ncbi:MAG: YaaR family protein [Treponemataceae bacterium]
MAKVDFPDGPSPFFTPAAYSGVKRDDKKLKERSKVSPFSHLLDSATTEAEQEAQAAEIAHSFPPSEEALRVLLDDLHEIGEELQAKPFPDNIKRYKSAVRNFLHYIVENGYTAEERTSGTNILKRKKFTLIQVVDRKLEQLAAGILAGQRSRLEILARVDEINGLLVDLIR